MRNRRTYHRMLDDHARRTTAAFTRSVTDAASATVLADVARQIERGNVDGVVEATNFTPGYFAPVVAAVTAAFSAGGGSTATTFPLVPIPPRGVRTKLRFDVTNPRAEATLRGQSGALIREVTDEHRGLISDALANVFATGDNPTDAARDIVGPIDPRTKRRSGGIIGLTRTQADTSRRARARLASGDPEELTKYLNMELRDHRFDSTVRRAIREGGAVPARTIVAASRSYNNRMLKYRGNVIGRTETLRALNGGRDEALRQLKDTGAVNDSHIKRIWDATGDSRTRETHRVADGQAVVGMDAPFDIGGYAMMYPGDPAGPPEESIQCRCYMETRIDFIAAAGGVAEDAFDG